MSVFYSAKMVLDEALATIGGVNNPDLRARALAMANQLVQRCASLFDFKELFVFWRGEVPKADSVDRMMPLEMTNIPADMDRLHRAWIMKRTNNQWERLPLKILATGQFMDQFMSGMFEQTPHDAPRVVSLKQMQAIRQDVTREYRMNANALELGTLAGQDGWTMGTPAGTLAAIQNDTPLANTDRAIKFAPEIPVVPPAVPVAQDDFEARTVGDLNGQGPWVHTGNVLWSAGNVNVSNTPAQVLAGLQSAVSGYAGVVNAISLGRPCVLAVDYSVRWNMRATISGIEQVGASALNATDFGNSQPTNGDEAWRVYIQLSGGVPHVFIKVAGIAGSLPGDYGPITQAAPYEFKVDVTAGNLTVNYNGVPIFVFAAAPAMARFTLFSSALAPGDGGSWDNVVCYDTTVPFPPNPVQYVKMLSSTKRYQFSMRVRRNPDYAAGVASVVSLMVATSSTVTRVGRAAGAIVGIDVAHQTNESATLTVYHDGAVKASGIALPSASSPTPASTVDPEESMEVIVIVDENRTVTVLVDDVSVYSATAAIVAADRLLMSGDGAVVGRIAWQGLSLDMTGLSVSSTVAEDPNTEAAVTVYVDPEKRTERRYPATGLGMAPKTLISTTIHGVKSFTKSNVSRGLITLKSGDGQLLAVLREGEMAAVVPVLQIGGFPNQPYPLLLHYKIRPPMLMGPGDAITHLPECAVKWVIQKLKVTLMKGREDIDWQAENEEIKRLEVEMGQVMGAEQVDRAYVDFDEGF